jgi:uncharacterized protein YqeY
MSLLDKIKADQLSARKSKDTVAASLLTTLIGESTKVSDEEFKKGLTEITDEKVIVTIKKFLKGAEETKKVLDGEFTRVLGHSPSDDQTYLLGDKDRAFMEVTVPKMRIVEREIAILNGFLPKQMDENQLREAIETFKASNPDANMGAIMSYLKTTFAGLYDGKLASQIAKG